MALLEAGAEFQEYEIDLQNKPAWYQHKVNAASKGTVPDSSSLVVTKV